MAKTGIPDNKRKSRGLTFHSYRHSVITILRSTGVSDSKIHYLAGHRQSGIQGRYTHFGPGDLEELVEYQERLLGKTGEQFNIRRAV